VTSMVRSSAVTLALGYIALGLVALVLFAAPLWYAWQGTIREGRAEILQADAQRLSDVYRRDGIEALRNFIDARLRMRIAGDRLLLLTDATGGALAGNLEAWPNVPTVPGDYRVQIDLGSKGIQTALVHVAALGNYNLLVGRDNRLFAPLEKRFWYGLTGAVAVLSIAGLLIGVITRRALMSRVDSIRQTVSAIIHGDLAHRLPTHLNDDDELNTLSRTINGMLDQIEQLVRGVRNVSNSIAHDLRTPLAELRSRLEELALMRPPPEQAFSEVDGAVADVDRVIRIFDALLRLAEIDAGLRRSGFIAVDAADLAATAVEFYAPAAELKGIALTLRADGPTTIAGDPVLLAQALSNLIDNALKFTPNDGMIHVAVQSRPGGSVDISVADNGPGIDDAEKAKVVERFYRGDASRGTPGVGLGLSLAQAVAKLHGSALELSDLNPGLSVRLTIPADSAPAAPPASEPSASDPARLPGIAATSP
jgi:signal transduction histidine kinase